MILVRTYQKFELKKDKKAEKESLEEITPALHPCDLERRRKAEIDKIKDKIMPYLEEYHLSSELMQTIEQFFAFLPNLANIEQDNIQNDFIKQIIALRKKLIEEKKNTTKSLEDIKKITIQQTIDKLNKKTWLAGSVLKTIIKKKIDKIFQKIKIFSDLFLI